MAELGSAYVNIIPKAPGIEKNLQDLLGKGAESAGGGAGQKAGSSLLSGLKKAVTVAAVGKIIKDAFSAGGDLQQSFGGLDTIYGDAAAAAKKYAQEAALAGISANSYAEQAVSVGAALKQAFGGDTNAAMEAANVAIMDMTDNAAKMGTPLGSIQQAYQGFAKQNYTMLDNLKLGYGGTKTEMERLLADAEKLTGVKYDIGNLGDVYSAIHAIQGELGLTGVAAQEAETTLTGSFGAVQASWTNVMAAMTTGEGLDVAMKNLATSAGNFANVVLKMVGNVGKQLPTMIGSFFSMGSQLVVQIVKGIIAGIPNLVAAIPDMITTLLQGITSAAGTLGTGGGEIIGALIAGILESVPLILAAVPEIILSLLNAFLINAGSLVGAGLELIAQIAIGLVQGFVDLVATSIEVFPQIDDAIRGQNWASIGDAIVAGIGAGLRAAWDGLVASFKGLISRLKGEAQSELEINSPSKLFAREVGQWIPAGVAVGIEGNLSPVDAAISRMTDTATAELRRATIPGMNLSAQRYPMPYSGTEKERPVQVDVYLQGDAKKIFKVVQTTNGVRTKATGYNALARA